MITTQNWAFPHLHSWTHRTWCKYLIMTCLFVEAWLRGGVWQLVLYVPPSQTQQRLHWTNLLYSAHLLTYATQTLNSTAPRFLPTIFQSKLRQQLSFGWHCRLEMAVCELCCVSRADFPSKTKKGKRTWQKKEGVKAWRTGKETDRQRSRCRL